MLDCLDARKCDSLVNLVGVSVSTNKQGKSHVSQCDGKEEGSFEVSDLKDWYQNVKNQYLVGRLKLNKLKPLDKKLLDSFSDDPTAIEMLRTKNIFHIWKQHKVWDNPDYVEQLIDINNIEKEVNYLTPSKRKSILVNFNLKTPSPLISRRKVSKDDMKRISLGAHLWADKYKGGVKYLRSKRLVVVDFEEMLKFTGPNSYWNILKDWSPRQLRGLWRNTSGGEQYYRGHKQTGFENNSKVHSASEIYCPYDHCSSNILSPMDVDLMVLGPSPSKNRPSHSRELFSNSGFSTGASDIITNVQPNAQDNMQKKTEYDGSGKTDDLEMVNQLISQVLSNVMNGESKVSIPSIHIENNTIDKREAGDRGEVDPESLLQTKNVENYMKEKEKMIYDSVDRKQVLKDVCLSLQFESFKDDYIRYKADHGSLNCSNVDVYQETYSEPHVVTTKMDDEIYQGNCHKPQDRNRDVEIYQKKPEYDGSSKTDDLEMVNQLISQVLTNVMNGESKVSIPSIHIENNTFDKSEAGDKCEVDPESLLQSKNVENYMTEKDMVIYDSVVGNQVPKYASLSLQFDSFKDNYIQNEVDHGSLNGSNVEVYQESCSEPHVVMTKMDDEIYQGICHKPQDRNCDAETEAPLVDWTSTQSCSKKDLADGQDVNGNFSDEKKSILISSNIKTDCSNYRVPCQIEGCFNTFETQSGLENHIRKKHTGFKVSKSKTYCQICGDKFLYLDQHISTVHGHSMKGKLCPVCKQEINNDYRLHRKHCNICPYGGCGFKNKQVERLMIHIERCRFKPVDRPLDLSPMKSLFDSDHRVPSNLTNHELTTDRATFQKPEACENSIKRGKESEIQADFLKNDLTITHTDLLDTLNHKNPSDKSTIIDTDLLDTLDHKNPSVKSTEVVEDDLEIGRYKSPCDEEDSVDKYMTEFDDEDEEEYTIYRRKKKDAVERKLREVDQMVDYKAEGDDYVNGKFEQFLRAKRREDKIKKDPSTVYMYKTIGREDIVPAYHRVYEAEAETDEDKFDARHILDGKNAKMYKHLGIGRTLPTEPIYFTVKVYLEIIKRYKGEHSTERSIGRSKTALAAIRKWMMFIEHEFTLTMDVHGIDILKKIRDYHKTVSDFIKSTSEWMTVKADIKEQHVKNQLIDQHDNPNKDAHILENVKKYSIGEERMIKLNILLEYSSDESETLSNSKYSEITQFVMEEMVCLLGKSLLIPVN